MKKFFEGINNYVQSSDWTLIAGIKACVLAIGMFFGMQIPKKHKKWATIVAAATFLVTYLPMMIEFIQSVAAFYHNQKLES